MILRKFEEEIVNTIIKSSKGSGVNLINMHRLNTDNSGDLMCAPYRYFEEIRNNSSKNVDILGYLSKNILKSVSWAKDIKESNIIAGGGGLLDRPTFNHSIDVLSNLKNKGNKVVLWGVGHNNPSIKASKLFYKQINSFDVIGVRDFEVEKISNVDWVPCVSCMSKELDSSYEIIQEIGVIEHEHIPIPGAENFNFPSLKNKASFSEIIKFIGKTEVIITNSYHVMYWSILMKRKVLVIPNSSKMLSFKYKVPFIENASSYKEFLSKAVLYEEALEDCRERNLLFSDKVFNYLDFK